MIFFLLNKKKKNAFSVSFSLSLLLSFLGCSSFLAGPATEMDAVARKEQRNSGIDTYREQDVMMVWCGHGVRVEEEAKRENVFSLKKKK